MGTLDAAVKFWQFLETWARRQYPTEPVQVMPANLDYDNGYRIEFAGASEQTKAELLLLVPAMWSAWKAAKQ